MSHRSLISKYISTYLRRYLDIKMMAKFLLVCLLHAILQKKSIRNGGQKLKILVSFLWSIFNNYSAYRRRTWVDHNYLISNKRECNNCFIKNAPKISINFVITCRPEETIDLWRVGLAGEGSMSSSYSLKIFRYAQTFLSSRCFVTHYMK